MKMVSFSIPKNHSIIFRTPAYTREEDFLAQKVYKTVIRTLKLRYPDSEIKIISLDFDPKIRELSATYTLSKDMSFNKIRFYGYNVGTNTLQIMYFKNDDIHTEEILSILHGDSIYDDFHDIWTSQHFLREFHNIKNINKYIERYISSEILQTELLVDYQLPDEVVLAISDKLLRNIGNYEQVLKATQPHLKNETLERLKMLYELGNYNEYVKFYY